MKLATKEYFSFLSLLALLIFCMQSFAMAGNTWELTTSMPSAGLGTAMIGGKIYAISGQDQPYSYLAKVESYNPVTNT